MFEFTKISHTVWIRTGSDYCDWASEHDPYLRALSTALNVKVNNLLDLTALTVVHIMNDWIKQTTYEE